MPATTAQQSTQDIMKNANNLRKAQDGLWKIAKKAPMFSVTKKGATGREYRQYTRLINTQAYKVAMSGACAAVTGEMQLDMEHLGMEFTPDSKTRPWSMSLSPGAAFMLEQFLATIVQQIVKHNLTIRDGLERHKRNHKEVTKLAIDEVRQSVFMAAMAVPGSTSALPFAIARKKKEGEAEAPGDQEAAEGAADADAEAEEEEDGEEAEAEEEEEA